MKLAAIYNTWGDVDLLTLSVNNLTNLVDCVIIVYSTKSNYGKLTDEPLPNTLTFNHPNVHFKLLEPTPDKRPQENETFKRNYGLEIARQWGYTHFLTCDADEFYEPEPFLKAKEMFHVKPDLAGLVCNCQTYFGSPKLTIGLDITLVPFIHKLTDTIKHGFNRNYPFAWDGPQIRIDPTRSLNIHSGVERTDLIMHHASWIRKDYQKKIRNSTARANLERSSILKDLVQAKEGYFCEYYQKTLVRASVDFNIPEYEFDEGGNATIRKDL